MSTQDQTLCLACSSSLPPYKSTSKPLYVTDCCGRPICPSCITANPRLARYNPCLVCLAGVGVLASSSGSGAGRTPISPNANLSGAVRDEDTFVLGDDDEDEEEDSGEATLTKEFKNNFEIDIPAGRAEGGDHEEKSTKDKEPVSDEPCIQNQEAEAKTTPYKYYLNRSDLLQGLSLRFGVNVHEICKLNNLPLNVVRNPHLLHTRAFILLPPSAKPHPSLSLSTTEQKEREAKRVRERAEKKLQMLTKEVDWRVAKAYVALADDEESKQKEATRMHHQGGASLEAVAVEQYLDDLEWEAEELRGGRAAALPKFPYADFGLRAARSRKN